MISKQLQNAFNTQINAELWSAYLYLSMSMAAERKGLSGIANWFYIQWLEEQDHARILQRFLIERDIPVILQPIAAVPTEWDSPEAMFNETLEHECKVTAMIDELMTMAHIEKDYASQNRLQWFVAEQVEEEDSARAIISSLKRLGGNGLGLYQLDGRLGEREYHRASALE